MNALYTLTPPAYLHLQETCFILGHDYKAECEIDIVINIIAVFS